MDYFKQYGLRLSKLYGIALGLFLTAYFLSLRVLGLGHEYYLRVFLAFILFGVIYQVIRKFQAQFEAEKYGNFITYYRVAMRTAFIGIASFSVFLALYLDILDPAFMTEIKMLESGSPYLSPVSIASMVFIEGLGSAFVICYTAIQLLKKPCTEMITSDS